MIYDSLTYVFYVCISFSSSSIFHVYSPLKRCTDCVPSWTKKKHLDVKRMLRYNGSHLCQHRAHRHVLFSIYRIHSCTSSNSRTADVTHSSPTRTSTSTNAPSFVIVVHSIIVFSLLLQLAHRCPECHHQPLQVQRIVQVGVQLLLVYVDRYLHRSRGVEVGV